MKKGILHTLWRALPVALLLGVSATVCAQQTQYVTRWKGAQWETLRDQHVTDPNTGHFYLYNVGTGYFLKAAGEWGTQAMLRFQDYGGRYFFTSGSEHGSTQTLICAGLKNNTGGDGYLGVNWPNITCGERGDGTIASDHTHMVLVDLYNGVNSINFTRSWSFNRVQRDDIPADAYVYEMKETLTPYSGTTAGTAKDVWIGAKYGVTFSDNIAASDNQLFADGIVTYTADNTATGQKAKNPDLFLWQLITAEQFEEVVDAQAGGLNANFNYLLKDANFDRHQYGDYSQHHDVTSAWTLTSQGGTASSSTLRYDWREYDHAGEYLMTDNWDALDLRILYQDTRYEGGYCYGSLDGKGTIHQTITAPKAGTYVVKCKGFSQGNAAYLYAKVNGGDAVQAALPQSTQFTKCTQPTTESGSYSTGNWPKQTNHPYYSPTKNDADFATVGKALSANKDGAYTVTLMLRNVTQGASIELGISKPKATQSKMAHGTTANQYYYDTDYVAFDDVEVTFMSDPYIVLDEDNTVADSITSIRETDKPLLLKRKFTVDQWNTLVLPLSLTGQQVRQAFGSETKVAELKGIGSGTGAVTDGSKDITIDFQTIDMQANTTAIEAGKLYLVKPTKTPSYRFDQFDFTSSKDAQDQNHTVHVAKGEYYSPGIVTFDGTNVDTTVSDQVGEWTSPEGGSVTFHGVYLRSGDSNPKAPAGAYAWSGGKGYHLTAEKPIKGFRGWIENTTGRNLVSRFISSTGMVTGISEIHTERQMLSRAGVYDLMGRRVRTDNSLEGLPAGMYIVNGKKTVKR